MFGRQSYANINS